MTAETRNNISMLLSFEKNRIIGEAENGEEAFIITKSKDLILC